MYGHERSLVKQMEGKPFALIGVNCDRGSEDLQEVLEKEKITCLSFWNGAGGIEWPISRAWGVSGWPTLVIIDSKGIIRHKWAGSPGDAALDKAIEKVLAEIASEKS